MNNCLTVHIALTVETRAICIYSESEGTLSFEQRPGRSLSICGSEASSGSEVGSHVLEVGTREAADFWVYPTAVLEGIQFRFSRGSLLWLTFHVSPDFFLCHMTFVWIDFAIVWNSFYVSLRLKVNLPKPWAKARQSRPCASCHSPSLGSC